MRRCFAMLVAVLAVLAGGIAPPASAEGTPIGNLGDTLHVDFKGIVADVTVHDVIPTEVPPGWGWNGSPRWRAQGRPGKAPITIPALRAPNPHAMAPAFTFTGVTPYADAYVVQHTGPPHSLQGAPRNPPPA